ncbi:MULTISPECIES: hypothetical protein [unclassified Mesorhizobium]|nr:MULTISPECIES: hypothetical protein [unclassified Mesorhizobium]
MGAIVPAAGRAEAPGVQKHCNARGADAYLDLESCDEMRDRTE